MESKVTITNWYPERKLIVTHISGEVDEADIERWETSLLDALEHLEEGGTFKILVNLHGFKAVNLNAHKRFRAIIPLTLAQYGWKAGYVDLFEEEARTIVYTNNRGITCIGAAHCHHDATKMELYETGYSSRNEHFFTDPREAQNWIESLIV